MSGSPCCSQPAPLSSCRLVKPPQLLHKQGPVPSKRGVSDQLEAMLGREMQDLEYAQWFFL